MASNEHLYPPDYTVTSSAGGASLGTNATLDDAIDVLTRQSRSTALKESFNRRDAGQNATLIENLQVSAIPEVMPLYLIGRQVQTPPFLGTKALLGGGRSYASATGYYSSITRLQFSGETVTPLGVKLSRQKSCMATLSSPAAGLYLGGFAYTSNGGNILTDIDKISYADERAIRLATTLASPVSCSTGGIGNKVNGYLMGGINGIIPVYVFTKAVVRYRLATDTPTPLGNLLPNAGCAPHNGASNQYNGYMFGSPTYNSVTNIWSFAASFIQRLVMATEIASALGTAMTTNVITHAISSYSVKAYIAGGLGQAGTFSNTVLGFTYSNESLQPLSATLAEAKIGLDGAGSSLAGYYSGGDTSATNWSNTTSIDRLTYASETSSRIGSQLPSGAADQGAVADFGAGFSY